MGSAKRLARSAARAGSSPLRGYFNRGVESLKELVRQLAADERHASAMDRDGVLVAMDRLQEAVGFLGLQLSEVRAELDALRTEIGLARPDTAGGPPPS
jgi:hypothetical protein